MEELGSIDININENTIGGGGGAGGGGGDIGQGPRIPPRYSTASQQQTILSSMMSGIKGMYPQVAVSNIGNLSGSINSLRETIRRPTTGGIADLLRKDGVLGRQLTGLGATGARVATAMLGIGAAAGAATVAFEFTSSMLQRINDRVSEIGKFSAALVSAQVGESLAKLQRGFSEAAKNGEVYARALRLQTINSDIYSSVVADLTAFGSVLAMGFTNLGTALLYIVKPITWAFGEVSRLMVKFANFVDSVLTPRLLALVQKVAEAIANLLVPLSGFLKTIGYGASGVGLDAIIFWLRTINRDQNKQKMNPVNDWFLGDVKAMTGREYSMIGR